jgi:hypothetical protein
MLREFLDLIFSGQMTDNGGGATLESFYQVLREMGLTNEDFYFVANCTLHDLQLVMASPMEKVFGLGGTEKYNAMQLLHSMHDLEVFYFRETWKDLFAYTMQMVGMEGVVPRHMPEPITTRWWWLGIACDIAIKYWTIFKDIAIGSVNTFGSTSYANLVGSSLDTLMCEETFYGDIIFTKCFHDFVMTPHFDFLQSRGDRSKVAGFNSNNILVRYFLLALDLHSLQDGKWKEHPAFKEYIDHLNSPRWPTKEEEEKKLEKERRTEANSPSRLLKLDNDAGKIKSKLSKVCIQVNCCHLPQSQTQPFYSFLLFLIVLHLTVASISGKDAKCDRSSCIELSRELLGSRLVERPPLEVLFYLIQGTELNI